MCASTLLQPKKNVEVYRMSQDMTHREPVQDPELAREAISFYQVASHVFRSGLYRNKAPQPPDDGRSSRLTESR